MSYELNLKEFDDYVEVKVKGERKKDAVLAAAIEIKEICKAKKISKVLVDVREFTGRLELLDSYDLISLDFPKVKESGIHLQVAIVDDVRFKIKYRFFETVARNRGFNIRLFGDIKKAAEWLH